MSPRLVIPVQSHAGTHLSDHFGRAPYFVLIDIDDSGNVVGRSVEPNTSEHMGGRGHAHDNIFRFNPNVVIVHGMGPWGIMSFQERDVAVLRANSHSVDEVLNAYLNGALQELTEGCLDAHHK